MAVSGRHAALLLPLHGCELQLVTLLLHVHLDCAGQPPQLYPSQPKPPPP